MSTASGPVPAVSDVPRHAHPFAIIGPHGRTLAREVLCPLLRTECAGTVGAQHAAPPLVAGAPLLVAGEFIIRIKRSRRAAATTAPIPVRRAPDLAKGRLAVTPTRRRSANKSRAPANRSRYGVSGMMIEDKPARTSWRSRRDSVKRTLSPARPRLACKKRNRTAVKLAPCASGAAGGRLAPREIPSSATGMARRARWPAL